MVNTRIFEQLFSDAPRSQDDQDRRASTGGAKRSLAVSGSRAMRAQSEGKAAVALRRADWIDAAWDELSDTTRVSNPDRAQRRIASVARDPALSVRFDQLRTQLLQAFRKRELCSIGICSATPRAGTTFVVGGLLASLARLAEARVVGLDLNVAAPSLQDVFALEPQGGIVDFLTGKVAVASHLQKLTESMALGLNDRHDPLDGQLALQSTEFPKRLAEIETMLAPDMIVCDLPPLLSGDSSLAALPHLDAVLVVADATRSTASELAECERLIQDRTQFLGILLNRGDERAPPPSQRN